MIRDSCSPLNKRPKEPSPFTNKGLPKSPGARSNPGNPRYSGNTPKAPVSSVPVELPVKG